MTVEEESEQREDKARYKEGSEGSSEAVLCIELEFGDTSAAD